MPDGEGISTMPRPRFTASKAYFVAVPVITFHTGVVAAPAAAVAIIVPPQE